ncbi:tetratricopeptide repeat protein [Desulfococcaceae bacterium HSG8]|nr:tetratricopeptide repeat protein [Desulfococcaceae bacterium HSG8]
MQNTIRHIILSFFVFFLPISASFAGTSLKIDSDRQFDFAEHYFSNGEYFKAIREYERFIYFFPEDRRVKPAMYKIGMAYFESKGFKEAINVFERLIEKYGRFRHSDFRFRMSDPVTKAYFMISESYMKLNSPGPAISDLHNLIALTKNTDVKDECCYRIGWIYLETESWERARAYFGKISEKNRDKYKLEKLSRELGRTESADRKSPSLAGFFSIVPGGGYLYCGRYYDAATAFVLNSALMYAAYESFDSGNHALGGVITLVELGFYSGSIYGSVNSARKYNRKRTMQFLENLRKNTKISLSGEKEGLAVSFQYKF